MYHHKAAKTKVQPLDARVSDFTVRPEIVQKLNSTPANFWTFPGQIRDNTLMNVKGGCPENVQ